MADFSDWSKAWELYNSKQFEEALREFQKHPVENSSYYYNVGTIYLQLKKPAQALAYLEKANLLHPHDPDIEINLTQAREQASQSIGVDQLDPASTWIENLGGRLSGNGVQSISGILTLVCVGVLIRTYLKTRSLKPMLRRPPVKASLMGIFLGLVLMGLKTIANLHPTGISAEALVIRSGPGDQYVQLGQLPAGIKIRLLSPMNNPWCQIRYSTDEVGWVKTAGLLTL